MKLRIAIACSLLFLCLPQETDAQSLTLQECLESAEKHMPLLKQESIMLDILANKLETYNKTYLPRITANGQASYQSDVPEFPFSLPGIPGLELPQGQYRAYAEIQQPLFDAGISKALKAAETAKTDVSMAALRVGLSEYKRQVAQLYLQILMAEQQQRISTDILDLLNEQMLTLQSALDNGVAQQNDVLKLQCEILNQQKLQDKLAGARESGMEILTMLTGLAAADRSLELPSLSLPLVTEASSNPQIELLDRQKEALLATESLVKGQRLPMVNAFGQAGVGAPNPYNFFEKDLSSFYIVGVRASWPIWDWGKTSLDRQNINLTGLMIDEQQNQKQLEIESAITRMMREHEILMQNLEADKAISALKTTIRENTAIQLEQGVLTLTDYLSEVLAEQLALNSLSLGEIALTQNIINIQIETGILR